MLGFPLLLVIFGANVLLADQSEFYSGYAGSLPTDPRELARTYFDDPTVRKLILDLATGPMLRDRAEAALKGTRFSVQDLLRLKLVTERDGRLFIGFSYFNDADMRAIDRVGRLYVPSLVQAFLQHQQAFEQILSRFPVKTVSSKKLAFILIAGFSLNWDGLKVTKEMQYRKPIQVEGNGWRYSFWAAENVRGRSTKEFYWGSSTFPAGKYNFSNNPVDFAFSSFGDPSSDPRMNFPDLLYTPVSEMDVGLRATAQQIGLIHETGFGTDLQNVLGFELARDIAALLFALRKNPGSADQLASSVRDREKIAAYLSLLKEIQYIERDADGRYHLLIPVFDVPDKEIIEKTLSLGRQILERWLSKNYPRMKTELSGLTAIEQGVPFESLFTQIWHEWFGLTTRELVHAGVLFDPYSKEVTFKGSFSTLWRVSLFDLSSTL